MCIFMASLAPATTIIVDHSGGGDFDNVQAGVDAAAGGDTVLVYPGTYTSAGDRDITFYDKNIVLRGRDGAGTTVLQNTAGGGHRLFYLFNGGQDTTCIVDGLTLRGGDIADIGGGAIHIDGTGNVTAPKFINLVIENNYGYHGGGAYVNCSAGAATPVFRNCQFLSNLANQNGGGIYCGMNGTPLVADCTFINNETAFGMGGGMHCNLNSPATVTRCWFEGNGAATFGGGFSVWRSSAVITNSTFLNNTAAGSGGAINCWSFASAQFSGVTMVENSAQGEGGSIYVQGGATPTFDDCIIAFTKQVRGAAVACDGTGDPTFQYCCVFGNFGGDALCGTATDIINEDPLFCDVTIDDLTVAANSPCLPAGNLWSHHLGSLDQGCTLSPVVDESWGTIKAMFR